MSLGGTASMSRCHHNHCFDAGSPCSKALVRKAGGPTMCSSAVGGCSTLERRRKLFHAAAHAGVERQQKSAH
eukprot:2456716-Pleurochrysis_carterae.AAC.3